MSDSGMAEQLSSMNGPAALDDCWWSARAASSLPVPVSPVTSTTGTGWRAIFSIIRTASRIASLSKMSSPLRPLRYATWRSRTSVWSAFLTDASTSSRSNGFLMKSKAPRRSACTALSTSPCAVMTMAFRLAICARAARSTSSPSMSPRRRSTTTQSGTSSRICRSASAPLAASVTEYPAPSSAIRTERRIRSSSSTIRTDWRTRAPRRSSSGGARGRRFRVRAACRRRSGRRARARCCGSRRARARCRAPWS